MLMAAPGTKYLYKDLTGMVHIHAYDAHLRVTSTVQAVVSSMDLEKEGFDAFIAPDATDAAFGALIREGLDRTRFFTFGEDPYVGKGSGGFRKKLSAWHKAAAKAEGKKTVDEVHKTARACRCMRTTGFFLFTNAAKGRYVQDGFSEVSDATPRYWEALCDPYADDATLGHTARAALDAMVV